MDSLIKKLSKDIKTIQEYDYSDSRITRYIYATDILINLFIFTCGTDEQPDIVAQKIKDNLPTPIRRRAIFHSKIPYTVDAQPKNTKEIKPKILAQTIFYLLPIATKYIKEPDEWQGAEIDYRFWESFLFAIEDGITIHIANIQKNTSARAYGGFKKNMRKAPIKEWVYKRAKEIHAKNKTINNHEIANKIFSEEYEPKKWETPLKTDAEFNTIYRWVLDALKK